MLLESSDEDFTDDELYSDKERSGNSSINSILQPLHDSEGTSRTSYHSDQIPLTASLFQRNSKLAKSCVILALVLERMVYYGLLGNLAVFVNIEMNYSPGSSTITSLVFLGSAWFTCLIGAFFGDVFLGRHRTIISGLCFYVIGFVAISLLDYFIEKCDTDCGKSAPYVTWLILSLLAISLGEGCFKSNMSAFGADQISNAHDNELRTFFNYYYWSINIGAFIGSSGLTYLQESVSYWVGYVTASAIILLALIIFILPGTRNYHIPATKENLLRSVYRIYCNAKRNNKKDASESQYESYVAVRHWLDKAKTQYGGRYADSEVEDVKKFFSTFSVLFFLIIYCACYSQVNGIFLVQGVHMKIIHFGAMSVPACWFSLFNIITVLLFVPIINRYFYPYLDKLTKRCPPYVFRMSIGMLLGSFAMISGGVVEHFRLQTNTYVNNTINSNIVVCGKDIPIWYQIPQYGLMGLSEIFTLIAGLEYAYCESPKSMQSLVTGLFFLCNGFGSLLSSALLALGDAINYPIISSYPRITPNFIPALKNSSRIDQYFYFLAVLNLLNLIAFMIHGIRKFNRKKKHHLEDRVAAYIQDSLDESLKHIRNG